MIKSEKKLSELARLLTKDNNTAILQAIDSLRNEQPFEGVVGLLVSLYNKSDDKLIRKTIELFMNDLKHPSSRAEVVNEIKKPWKESTKSMLVSSCWQSGLDYSGYLDDFVNIFLEGDYVTAIECLTVISESVHNINRSAKEKIIRIINENSLPMGDEKSVLTLELISILEK